MIEAARVQEVKRLLAEGALSQRRIAGRAGVSRGMVAAIAQGKRPDYESRQRTRIDEDQPLGPVRRCPGCGGRVQMPCLLCRVRKMQARSAEAARSRRRLAREMALRLLLRQLRDAQASRPGPLGRRVG